VGTNLHGLHQAAEKLGFTAKAVKGPFEALAQVPLPAIAHVKTEEGLGHFLVLHRARKGSVVVADPARGIQKLTRDEFCRRWTGYALLPVPDPAPHPPPPLGPPSPPPLPPLHRRPRRSLRLRHPDAGAGDLDLLFHPAPGRLGPRPPRGTLAQRPGARHGPDRPVPNPLRPAPPVPGGPRRPESR